MCEYNVDDYKVKIDGIPIEDYGRPTGRTVYPSSITQTHNATQRKATIYLKPIEKDITTEEAVEILKHVNLVRKFSGIYSTTEIIHEAIEKVLNELEKKEKIINAMAEEIADYTKSCPLKIFGKGMDCDTRCDTVIKKDCWRLYFEQEVKDE